ncbi:metallophosphoesterase [Mesobacillus campisalis]|uniref:Metallophosphoesterase n=1 Tax=Mesobacillus campisalis TaxID=1408103 RepID=A0A0M2SJD8_9BACI|nr:metallophosphoesterase [Mesobacillus campisalis]KKK34373.1 metallophosphoesterase [Mesobacillus campisalis]
MSTHMTRRSFLKKIFGGLIAIGGAGAGGYYYAHEIEPKLLEITRHTIQSPLLPPGFDGLKIVQFSDTHVGFQYTLEQLGKLVTKINSLDPDLILFSGDLIDDPYGYGDAAQIIGMLSSLRAVLGKYAVYGNHDHGGYGSDLYKRIMEEAGFTLLLNEARPVSLLDGSSIHIAGVDDSMLGKPDIAAAIQGIPQDSFKILLSHAPDLADSAAGYNIQLQLSGHSHGGQVQIPFYGPLVTPPHAETYPEGFYEVGTNKMKLYVNRGLGTTRLPFRFFSKPELTLFTLEKV